MRKTYHKELNFYKENDHMKRIKTIKRGDFSVLDEEENQVKIHVELFDYIEGIDDDILKMINKKIEDIKQQFEDKAREYIKYQTSLLKKIYLFNKLNPNAYSLVNLSLEEIFTNLAQIEVNPNKIWKYLIEAYGDDYFLAVIERVYGKRFAKDYEALYSEIDKVKQEAKFHMEKVSKQSEVEILSLRRIINERALEINALKEKQIIELEKVRKESFFHAEIEYQAKEAKCNYLM